MGPVTEWCGVCLQDDVKVIASQVIEQVPLCKGCVVAYSGEKDVLRDARQFLRDLDEDKPKKASGYEIFDPTEPAPPKVKYFCVCGCGTEVEEGERLVSGHTEKAPIPTPASKRKEPDKPLTPEEKRELLGTPVTKKSSTCLNCGKEFVIGKNSTGKYCTRDCYNAKQQSIEKPANRALVKTCKCGCGESFKPTGNAQQFINGHKPTVAIVRRGQEVVVPEGPVFHPKPCGCGCGETFTPTGARHKYILGHKFPESAKETQIVRQTTRKEITAQVVNTHEVETWTAGKERVSKLHIDLPSGGRLSLEWEGHMFEISPEDRTFIFSIADRMRAYAKQKAVSLPLKTFSILGTPDGNFITDMLDMMDQEEQNRVVEWVDDAVEVVKKRRAGLPT